MHWIFLALVACLVFLASYNPRTGNLTKYFAPETSVEHNGSREAQSDSDTNEQSERRPALPHRAR
jgi:hypothetical protein